MPSDEILNNLEKQSEIGDWFYSFKVNGGFEMLEKYIFKPMRINAINLFRDSIDPDDRTAITAAQQRLKLIEEIPKKMESFIQQGKLAKHQLLTLPKGDEG